MGMHERESSDDKQENLMMQGRKGSIAGEISFHGQAGRDTAHKPEFSHGKKHRNLPSSLEQLQTVSSFHSSWRSAKHWILTLLTSSGRRLFVFTHNSIWHPYSFLNLFIQRGLFEQLSCVQYKNEDRKIAKCFLLGAICLFPPPQNDNLPGEHKNSISLKKAQQRRLGGSVG